MTTILSLVCIVFVGVMLVFAWAMCRAAGCADDKMEELTGHRYSG